MPHLKDGASWAALEYARWEATTKSKDSEDAKGLVIVPVGIMYTDKCEYQSRVSPGFSKMSSFLTPFLGHC